MLSVERGNQYSELLLLRHAKSDQGLGLPDFERPLNARGREAARRMGQWLRKTLPAPELILCSPAQRTWETCHLLLEAMECQTQMIQWHRGIYEAPFERLLELLGTCPVTSKHVLLIGHNPGLEDLLRWLMREPLPEADNAKLLPTATLAWLEIPDDWSRLEAGCARLRQLMRPKDLADA